MDGRLECLTWTDYLRTKQISPLEKSPRDMKHNQASSVSEWTLELSQCSTLSHSETENPTSVPGKKCPFVFLFELINFFCESPQFSH